jgi:uncharacterized membrane protein
MNRHDPEIILSNINIPRIILLAGLFICLCGFIGQIIPGLDILSSGAGILCSLWIPGFAVMSIFHSRSSDEEPWNLIIGSVLISITLLAIAALILEQADIQAFIYTDRYCVTSYYTGFILLYTATLTLIGYISCNHPIFTVNKKELPLSIIPYLRGKLPSIMVFLVLICAFIGVGTWTLSHAQPEQTTELWLVQADGTAGSYQNTVPSGGIFSAVIGVGNNMDSQSEFSLTTRVNNSIIMSEKITLPPLGEVELPVTIDHVPGIPGEVNLISFDLTRLGSPAEAPFRRVSQPVRIT